MVLPARPTGAAPRGGDPGRWRAHIDLGFQRDGNRTVLRRRQHVGPLRVQKPFYPEAEVCHVYLLHPPGGMAGHDQLTINVTVAERAHVLLTTPAANKVYRTRDLRSEVIQEIDLAPGCSGEWLPQGTILFGGSSYAQRTVIRAASSARFSCWDSICLGRPASGDDFTQGSGEQSLAVFLDDKPLYLDRLDWTADAPLMCSGWGLQSYKVLSQLLMYPADEDVLERARQVTVDPAWQAVGRAQG